MSVNHSSAPVTGTDILERRASQQIDQVKTFFVLRPSTQGIYGMHTFCYSYDDGECFIDALRRQYFQYSGYSAIMLYISRFLFMQRIIVGRACLAPTSAPDIDVEKGLLLRLLKTEKDLYLSNAFYHPQTFRKLPKLSAEYGRHFTRDSTSYNGGFERGIYIDTEFDGVAASLWLGIGLFLSVAVGVVVGFCMHDPNLGLNIGTGVLAILSTLQGILILLIK